MGNGSDCCSGSLLSAFLEGLEEFRNFLADDKEPNETQIDTKGRLTAIFRNELYEVSAIGASDQERQNTVHLRCLSANQIVDSGHILS